MKLPAFALILTLALGLLAAPVGAEAQKPGKVYRIGWLLPGPRAAAAVSREAFLQGLRDLGWIEGQNFIIESRFAAGKIERLPALAAELAHLKVDIIFTAGPAAVRAAMNASRTIPIVFVYVGDPVASGLVISLAAPGGNVTGISDIAPEITGKLLELLTEAAPGVSRLAVVWVPTHPVHALIRKQAATAAAVLGVKLQWLAMQDVSDFEPAFAAMKRDGADALFVICDEFTAVHRHRIADLALTNRLPIISHCEAYVRAGGLMFYGQSHLGRFRHAARYVSKILNGAKPADLPVERPMRFELWINLKTAEALGLTIPPSVLFQADRVIK